MDKINIYIPSDYNGMTPESDFIDETGLFLSELSGGCTFQDSIGFYTSESGKIIKEKITIAYAFIDEVNTEIESKINDFCNLLKNKLNQESVLYTIDNTDSKVNFI